ncbi:MAG: DUF4417 domain-containing protein [Clostridiales bacterium]|nr:DUF4417 domain-containing protein [Clostridiales bacterium]
MGKEQKLTNEVVRQRYDVFKSWLVQGAEFAGSYDLPKLKACCAKPDCAIPFDKALKIADKNQWVHFYLDDWRFACVWHNPKAYLERLRSFDGVISPDFSLLREMPLSMQVWNTYRNRALAWWLQSNDVNVIPNVRWGDERTYEFCFDGIPRGGTVAISTNGCIQSKIDRYYFKQGLRAMVDRLAPKAIINYSYTPDDIFLPYKEMGMEIIQIPNWQRTVRQKGGVA